MNKKELNKLKMERDKAKSKLHKLSAQEQQHKKELQALQTSWNKEHEVLVKMNADQQRSDTKEEAAFKRAENHLYVVRREMNNRKEKAQAQQKMNQAREMAQRNAGR